MGDQVVEQLQVIVTASLVEPVQVTAVPKMSMDRIPQRSAVRRTQMAEQLVEVPTEPGYALAVLASKFYSRREICGILSGQGTTASGAEVIVDTPVPQGRRGSGGGPQCFLPEQSPAASDVEQIVDIPACRGLQGFLPEQSPAASDVDFKGVFALSPFSLKKKCGDGSVLGVGTAPGVEPIHAASLCRACGSRG